jgi:hypothetical protein
MYSLTILLNSALDGGEWSASRPGRVTAGETAHCTHCMGGCVDHRAGLNAMEKRKILPLPGIEPQPANP